MEIEKDFTNQNESNFIKKLYNYKIYKYDDTFYGFPKSKKANFEEEDYYLDYHLMIIQLRSLQPLIQSQRPLHSLPFGQVLYVRIS